MFEVIGAFICGEGAEELTDRCANGFDRPRRGLAQQMLELGKDLLDGVEVGGIFRQEDQLGASRADELANGFAFVAAKIVHDDDVAGAKRRDKDLFDILLKALAVDRTFKKPRSLDPVVAQRSQECRCVPVAVRDLGDKPGTHRRPSAQRRHVGFGPGLVDKDQTLRFDSILILGPLRPPTCHVGTVAFASHHGFF